MTIDYKGIDLTGKTAIVTGASRGLGAAIAILLGKRGANVVCNYVSDSSKARCEETAKTVEANDTKAIVVQADVGKIAQALKIVKAALQISNNGKINILIYK